MDRDVRLALLGDREAAKRLTEAGVLLMQGDCLELLKDIPDDSVDMVLCDPPYAASFNVLSTCSTVCATLSCSQGEISS